MSEVSKLISSQVNSILTKQRGKHFEINSIPQFIEMKNWVKKKKI